jgi:exodeoxyribonuclease V alpha subunit
VFDLDYLSGRGFFSRLDYFFAKYLTMASGEENSLVSVSLALVSKALSQGHICLDMNDTAGIAMLFSELEANDFRVELPDSDTWITALKASSMVSENIHTPLVLDKDNRLYLAKYYDFQNRLALNITGRALPKEGLQDESCMDEGLVDELVKKNFSGAGINTIPQQNAVKNALLNRFTLISGGPGTGKTYVINMIKKIFTEYCILNNMPEPVIICAAPTGKAASKLKNGRTIHSVLGVRKNRPDFYFNSENQLAADLVIIDEASMIDLMLMTRLLEAIPSTAGVVLSGDVHQLSSIQAGSVFSDICRSQALSGSVFMLEYNFRSQGKSGIEALSGAINDNDAGSVEQLLSSGFHDDIEFHGLDSEIGWKNFLVPCIRKEYRAFVCSSTIETALENMDEFRILCAHNSGEFGTLQINNVCENILQPENISGIHEKIFKRIIMVRTNDYQKGLFNGDTGVLYEQTGGDQTAFFRDQDAGITRFKKIDLPPHETAFAMTIHKSQGSEFRTVLVVIPDRLSRIITRQLLYTAVTRAKDRLIVAGNMDIIRQAVKLDVSRNSGLTAMIENMMTGMHQ